MFPDLVFGKCDLVMFSLAGGVDNGYFDAKQVAAGSSPAADLGSCSSVAEHLKETVVAWFPGQLTSSFGLVREYVLS